MLMRVLDPKPRRNGKCASRGCKRIVPPVARIHADPFCSTECARKWHEVKQREHPTARC